MRPTVPFSPHGTGFPVAVAAALAPVVASAASRLGDEKVVKALEPSLVTREVVSGEGTAEGSEGRGGGEQEASLLAAVTMRDMA